ncbi:Zinc finger CCCH domain-containing protein 24, partial [Bienertia sinuspersici]
GVVFKSAKKKKGMSVGFLTFEAAEQVKSATELLEGKSVGNEKLKVGDVIPRSCDEKIKSAQKRYQNVIPGVTDETEATMASNVNENGESVKSSVTKGKTARDAVTPLAHLPYIEQLEQKKNSLMQLLKKLTRNARKACPKGVALPEWVIKSREIGGLSCKLEGIIESPLINGYRNKCEFSVGYSVQGKPTVGFMLGNFREGVTAVEEPTDCPNVSRVACNYALIFQDFLQDSALPIWNRFNNAGFWRQLTVREGRDPQNDVEANILEVMLIVQVSTEGCNEDVINSELEKLTQAFVRGAASASPPLPLTALALQAEDVMSSLLRQYNDSEEQDDITIPSEKQHGTTENQTISVDNEAGPEVCTNEVNMDADHVWALIKQSRVCRTIPLKMGGLQSSTSKMWLQLLILHGLDFILLYISCNPETLMANAIELCTPLSETTEKGRKGQGWRNMSNAGLARHRLKSMPKSEPFQPVKAMAVDLFPHTPHCELVMLLER